MPSHLWQTAPSGNGFQDWSQTPRNLKLIGGLGLTYWVQALRGLFNGVDIICQVYQFAYGILHCLLWRHGGLVVSVLDFRLGGRWFEPGLCRRVVSLDKKLYSTLSLFTQVYKWVPAIIMLGDNLAMD